MAPASQDPTQSPFLSAPSCSSNSLSSVPVLQLYAFGPSSVISMPYGGTLGTPVPQLW